MLRPRRRAPLSFAQARLWFLYEWEPDSPAYNEAQAFRVVGALDVEAYQATYGEIMRRHEIWRTTYDVVDGEPLQLIATSVEWLLRMVDLSVSDREMHRLLAEEARRPFDLRRDLSWRALLLRLAPEDHICLVTQHHISCDGWSVEICCREWPDWNPESAWAFPAIFNLLNAPGQETGEQLELEVEFLPVGDMVLEADLVLAVAEEAGRDLRADWGYSAAMFEASTIARLHHDLECVLESIVTDPERRLADLLSQLPAPTDTRDGR